MKKISILFLLLFSVTAFSQENYALWSAYKTITVNTTIAGVPSTRTNYPLLVRFSGAGYAEVFASAAADGSDIRFTKPDGVTRCPHQIERWDAAGQRAEIWVLTDAIAGNGTTDFRIYWGRAGAPDSSNSAATFPTTNGFTNVWHLGDAPGITARPNAVTGNPAATPVNFPGGYGPKTGLIGLADSLSGGFPTTRDYMDLGTSPSYSDYTVNGFTFSAWVYSTAQLKDAAYWSSAAATPPGDSNRIIVGQSATGTGEKFRYNAGVGGNAGINGGANKIALNQWRYYAFTKDPAAGALRTYINGVLDSTVTGLADLPNVTRTANYLGRSYNNNDSNFAGRLDEARLANRARSGDWIKLDYETQKQGATCVILGASVAQVAPAGLSYSATPVTYGIGVAIAANNPTVTGVVSSWAVVPGLPAGLTLSTATGVITGTPTAASPATNYTVTATNGIGFATATVNIRVLAAPTALSYTSPVTYGVSVAITPNSPTVTGVVSNYSVSPALPAGLSLSAATGIITGTPTAASVATNYTVTASNVAGSVNATVNIRVLLAPTALTYSANPAIYGVGVVIAANNPAVTGVVQNYTVAPALPSGLVLSAATGVITGTPTAPSAAADYTVTATNAAGFTTRDVNILVLDAPTGLSYSQNPVIYPVNVAITPNTPTVTGTVQSWSVTPALPAGLVLSAATGIITGTPTAGIASQNYTLTAQNVAGSTTASLDLSVLAPPSGLSYSQNPASYGEGVAIASNTPTVSGTVTGYAVTPALPAGLAISPTTGIITGTPTAPSAAADYTITAGNAAGQTTVTLNITILSAPTGLAYSTNPAVYRVGTAITANTPSVTGTVTGYSIIPGLPAGLTLSAATGIISGTPTAASAATDYTLTAANVAGSVQVVVNITVLVPPSNLTYSTNPAVYGENTAIVANTPTVTGIITIFSVTPALPAGLALGSSTGIISGTPTAPSAAADYTVTATNPVGSTTLAVNITVLAAPTGLVYSQNPAVYRSGVAITNNTPTVTGTVTGYSVTPALPAGLSLSPTTGIISGTPSAASPTANYTVTAVNVAGSVQAIVSLTVLIPPANLTYATNPAVYAINAAITPNAPTVTGTVSSYAVTPALPAGLSLDSVTGVISGTPTLTSAAANYTVTATNPVGFATVTVNINVITPSSNFSYAQNPVTYGVGVTITDNIPTVTGTVIGYSISPPLPAGLAMSLTTGILSGTPTAARAAQNYTVVARTAIDSAVVQLNLAVLSAPTGLSYSLNPAVYGEGNSITNNIPAVTGNVTSYTVLPALPAGLSISAVTGVISGTPTVPQGATNYTITAANIAGNATVIIPITVLAVPSGLTYFLNPAVYAVNTAIAPVNAPTVTGTVSSFSVTPALPAGLNFSTATGIISGTPTLVSAAQNYTVTASNIAGNTTVTVNLTVLSAPSSLAYPVNPAIYGVGTAIAPNTPAVTGVITSYTINPVLPAGLSMSAATGIISGTPAVAATPADYVITGTNVAGSVRDTVNITVLSLLTNLAYSPNPAVYGVAIAITSNIPTVNGTAQNYSISPALPTGLVFSTITGVISGSATAASPASNYTVTAQNAAGTTTATLNITVLSAPSNLVYPVNPAAYGINAAIIPNVPTVTGTVTYSVSPALPLGLVLDPATGTVSGTPTVVSPAQSYTVTAQNVAGAVTFTLNIAVLSVPANLSYAVNPAVYAVTVAITPNTPTVTGTVSSYSVSPALPAGLALSATTGILSGTPSVTSPATNYTVTAANAAGSMTLVLNLSVLSPPTGLRYTEDTVLYTVGSPITQNTPTVTGTIARYTVTPALPAGLSLDTSTGIISGTPTAAVTVLNYTVSASNAAGAATFVIRITVLSVPTGLAYSQNPASYGIGTAIAPNVPTVTGVVTKYSVTPALPLGLVLDTVTGIITGTPNTQTLSANYSVSAQNASGAATVSLNLTVLSPPSNFAYDQNPALYGVGVAITPNTPTITGTGVRFSVTPALPAGLRMDSLTGIITGTPTAESFQGYLITAANAAGQVQVNLTMTVLAPTSSLTYSENPAVYTVGVAITQNDPAITGIPIGYSITPTLPSGLVLNPSTGVISGTPTAQAPALNYTVTAQNAAGPATITTLSIEVLSLSSNFSYALNTVTYAVNTAIAPNAPTVTGTVQSYSVSPNLPAGLSLDILTGIITGTPTLVSPPQNYAITGTNASGASTITLNLAVVAAPTTLTYAQGIITYPLNATIPNNVPTVVGTVARYSVSTALPQGLSLNTITGVISGIPTDTASARNYVITATNVAGSTTFTVNITVLAPPTAFTYSQNQVIYRVGTAATPNVPAITGAALTYASDIVLPAGIVLDPATGIISGTPTVTSPATTYTVTATNIAGSTQTSLTLTVDTAIFIPVRRGEGNNTFILQLPGASLMKITLPIEAIRVVVEIIDLRGKTLAKKDFRNPRSGIQNWNEAVSLSSGMLLSRITVFGKGQQIVKSSTHKIVLIR